VLMANQACIKALGLPQDPRRSPVMESPWLRFDAEAARRMRQYLDEARAGKVIHREETLLVGDRIVYEQLTLNPFLDAAGKVTGILLEGRNVTDLKDAQAALYEINERLEDSVRERTESLQAAVREKDMLLREIHHRVKNNLQIISSLLSLQSGHVRDPEVAGVLMESHNRVKSMALVHERLYAGEDLDRVGFAGYLRDLAGQLVRSSDAAGRQVHLDFDLEDLPLALAQAIPTGLAVHELVANSLKHAFPPGRLSKDHLCRVSIRTRNRPDGGFELEVEDNGVSFPPGFAIEKSKSLGLQLVRTLVKQLKGTLEVEGGTGTRFRIVAPAG
jgi:two-component sensor histidine kinase